MTTGKPFINQGNVKVKAAEAVSNRKGCRKGAYSLLHYSSINSHTHSSSTTATATAVRRRYEQDDDDEVPATVSPFKSVIRGSELMLGIRVRNLRLASST